MKRLIYLLLALTVVFFAFEMQENQKFYYAFNEKIPLEEVGNKIVVRYSKGVDKESITNAFKRTHENSSAQWHDNKTVVLTFNSAINKDEAIENLKKQPDVATHLPLYKINTGLEVLVTDELLVKFKKDVTQEQREEIKEKFEVSLIKQTRTYQLLKVSRGGNTLDIANKFQESGLVEFSHPNFLMKIEFHQQVIPNDPYFVNQFTLNNTGQVFNDGHFGTANADIDAPEAWAMTTGGNIVVAVLDQGVSPNHPDLPNARQIRLNGSNFGDGNPNDPTPTGNTNHGNSCAGVIAATQNNNEGIAGICANCTIMPIRISNADESIDVNILADAIDFATDNGADIISNSWGANSDNPNAVPAIVTAIQNATTQGRGGLGCIVIFSAGNNAVEDGFVHFPSNVNVAGVLTVGASDRNDLKSFYSPLGNPASSNNQLLDITAPSHRAYPFQIAGETFEAWTIDIPGNTGYNPWPAFISPGNPSVVPPAIGEQLPNAGANFQAYTGRFGGTSHSCPVVAGVAALVLTANPNLTQQQVFDIITGTADQVGGYVYTNGRSNELGFGRVNACQAVLQAYQTGNSVSGEGLVCTNTTYSLQNAPNADRIIWTSSNLNGLSINPTNGVATRQNNFNGQVTITATINSGCGSVSVVRNVWVGSPTSGLAGVSFEGPSCIRKDLTGQHYEFYATPFPYSVAGATEYEWSLTQPSPYISIGGGQGSVIAVVTVSPSTPTGLYGMTVKPKNSCGSTSSALITFYVYEQGERCSGGVVGPLSIYPNPFNESFVIRLNEGNGDKIPFLDGQTLELRLYNYQQETVLIKKIENWETIIDTRDLPEGFYLLHVIGEGVIDRRRIQILHN